MYILITTISYVRHVVDVVVDPARRDPEMFPIYLGVGLFAVVAGCLANRTCAPVQDPTLRKASGRCDRPCRDPPPALPLNCVMPPAPQDLTWRAAKSTSASLVLLASPGRAAPLSGDSARPGEPGRYGGGGGGEPSTRVHGGEPSTREQEGNATNMTGPLFSACMPAGSDLSRRHGGMVACCAARRGM
jgi:hypothetical protein